jgi:protein-glutamine gamma-glutamyltransferase
LSTTRRALIPGLALLGIVGPAVVAWSAVCAGFAVALAPVAALVAALPAERRPGRWAAGAGAIWFVAAPLLAGVPRYELSPLDWPGQLAGGAARLGAPGDDPWRLAAALVLVGSAWIVAAALARRHPGAAVLAAGAPWLAAVLLAGPQVSAWQGAVIVLAGLLWLTRRSTSARTAVVLSVAAALASGVAAHALMPQDRRLFAPFGPGTAEPRFRVLETRPTFERVADRRTGATMLEIASPEPAFWRMQVLDVFDGQGWAASRSAPRLAEPAAQWIQVVVRVRELLNDLAVAPGAIDHIWYRGTTFGVAGSAWRLLPRPEDGDTYLVTGRIVRADTRELRLAPQPRGQQVATYTRVGGNGDRSRQPPLRVGPFGIPLPSRDGSAAVRGLPIDVPLLGEPPDPAATAALRRSPYRGVAALARRLASGARTELQVVARAVSYLRDEGRFRYTTDVPPPGPFPLVDFLERTHAGYCQHFAGAAALLLRLAGVPARVVAGFGTGVRSHGSYDVRDVDAHDWIEVYFSGIGWVPFNPTPAAAPVAIAPQLDLVPPTRHAGLRVGARAAVLVGVLALVALAAVRRRRSPDDALGRLLGGPVAPATTLGRIGDELARKIGPHTAALAAEAQRARFGPPGTPRRRFLRWRIVAALVRDLGAARAAMVLLRATRPPTRGAGSAGDRASD